MGQCRAFGYGTREQMRGDGGEDEKWQGWVTAKVRQY